MVLRAKCREAVVNMTPEALALMRETKMTGMRHLKALSQVMRHRMTGECYLRVTREGLLEAMTFTLRSKDTHMVLSKPREHRKCKGPVAGMGWFL